MNKMNIYLLLYISFTLLHFSNASKSCSKDKKDCKEEKINKYSKEFNIKYKKYLNLIKEAKDKYTPCDGTNCRCHTRTISNDLSPFKMNGISEELIQGVKSKGTKYQIIEKRLYREENCMFPARCSGIEHFLLELVKKLPDMEFIVNTRDWPQIPKQYGVFGPVFSFSKTEDYYDIMYPAWSFWEGGPAISLYPRGIGRWDNHRSKLGKIGNETLWETKLPKVFFRGSRTSAERDPLVLLSRENPDLVDAQYTKNQAWKSDACFTLVTNGWNFFYPALKPWIHYIPVEADATKEKIKELIEFVVHHDDMAREIAQNGYSIIWNHLKMADVTCYWSKLLRGYAKLLTFKPVKDNGLMEIKKEE
ncbi:hypothetical protein NQ317_009658 [Molorchus minor]|uniref:Glycosyl transferase CAP10 domain-containing protein n=1 Tax=Molorchus minor TaxID=1323400 RepID=A0ABQ9JL06_9CUCU|nr:hypothetical protein NQ317_009658 [Molorchus minor]